MDECASNNPCGVGAECVNMGGSFACICPKGFMLEQTQQHQVQTDSETESETENEIKQLSSGGYGNAFNILYHTDDDDDADADVDNNVGNTALSTRRGGVSASKATGAGLACIDVDECSLANGAAKCGTNAKCINFPGSYRCLCPSGFQGQGYLHCES